MKKKTIERLVLRKHTLANLQPVTGGEAVSNTCPPTTRKQDFPIPVFTAYDSCDCIIIYFHTAQPSCVTCPAPCFI